MQKAAPAGAVWVLADPRAGTAAQALGIAEALGFPFAVKPLAWTRLARLPNLRPAGSLVGLARPARAALVPPWPRLVIAAGRRSASVALWVRRQAEKAGGRCRLVQVMHPGHLAARFDLLVLPRHDGARPAANVIEIIGATHRFSPARLAAEAAHWRPRLEGSGLSRPWIALLVGGAAGGTRFDAGMAGALGRQVAALAQGSGGSVLATTSRRTGPAPTAALAEALGTALPERGPRAGGEPTSAGAGFWLYRAGLDAAEDNPYGGFLALADAVVVTGDSVSMLSEACATAAPVFLYAPEGIAHARHRRLHEALLAAGHVRPLGADLAPWPRAPLAESARVAAEIRARFPEALG
ncbi:MAG: mitochondrial fission ELM1 family protein [Alphaproteobacteria bacterium]|nr:mitochondrial fission ELM1 family protein [Alphaproteobacteria bacterium]